MSKKAKITIDSYNKTAEEYYKIVTSFEVLPELEEFMNFLQVNDEVLDLGCGPGHHSRIFSENGFQVTGIDFSKEMINIAKKEVPEVEFHVMDILKLKFKNTCFNGVWASASLLHVQKKLFPKALDNINNILCDKGIFYLSLKQGKGEELLKDERYGGVNKFYSYFSSNDIESMLKQASFKIINISSKEKRNIYDTNPWIHIFCMKN
ncbi:class I SAM-dependent methyltransferase [uncultured Aquimarina sp.]|uniref:class I SAM-dependent methyltransferase n=1 Tax=uncultured Aquimarina sp. TaxID=575652 RepID=UPI0026280CA8|nr:class I SAM-dependent methyltransferase [uncultured Aquimarina sp.]